jgi:hypothetical protein
LASQTLFTRADPAERDRSPLVFFLKLFPIDFIGTIVEQTNIYMRIQYHNTHKRNIKESDKTGIVEMLAFLGCLLASHMDSRPLDEMWNADYGSPLVARTFSYNRFFFLLRTLHLVDNNRIPTNQKHYGYERLQKVRPMMDTLTRNSRAAFVPGQWLTLDEAMIPTKVR